MTRRAAKIDANQPDVVARLRRAPGLSVHVTSALGDGFPDLVLGWRGRTYTAELKDPGKPPSKRRLTPTELAWHERWTGHSMVAETADDIFVELGIDPRTVPSD